MEKMPNYSQCNQDVFVDLYFKKKRNGFFLDIGAHDGITYSNSYFFEKHRDWKGICIEPIPDVYQQLQQNRSCKTYNVCISEIEGIVNFRRVFGYSEMLSGILEFMDEEHLNRINYECNQSGGSFEDVKIESKNINSILNDNNISKIDFLSIDTEGAEFLILKTIDFNKIDITFISVENNDSSNLIRIFLKSKGFKYVYFDIDDFYIKDNQSLIVFRLKVKLFLINKIWVSDHSKLVKIMLSIKSILK